MIDKIDGQSMDLVKENVEKLKELFPSIVKEDKIDFEELELLLGENINRNNEQYSFTWNGKTEATKLAQKRSTGTLRPCKEESKDWDNTQNLYIEGDNLEVLRLLQASYNGRIKMIYIDPPYNTGHDFVYKDNFEDNIKNYKEQTGQAQKSNADTDGRYHTNWLNMMYPRLKLARNLLKDDGVIFISIDDNEQANLKKICDEIFGENNYIGTIVWQTATDNNPTQISIEHEYIICYSKKKDSQPKWLVNSIKAEKIIAQYKLLKKQHNDNLEIIERELKKWIKQNVEELKGVSHYSSVDDKGVYYPGNSSNTRDGGYKFDIIHPITKKVCKKPDFGYRWTEETFLEAEKRGDVEWGKDETTIPHIKKRIETVQEMLKSFYYEDNRYWTGYLAKIMGKKVFDNPKSINLLQNLIKFTTKENDIILDFFAGSSSTADAAMRYNLLDGLNRHYILVQFPENLDLNLEIAENKAKPIIKNAIELCDELKKPHLITEIGKERIRRAGEKIKSENPNKQIDTGFKVFKLDSSNLKKWDNTPTKNVDVIQDRIQTSMDYVKEDRTELDLVYEVMLKYGIDLTLPITKTQNDKAYIIEAPEYKLLVCTYPNLTIEDIEDFANESVGTYLFADRCFNTDNLLVNAEEILKSRNKEMRLF